MPHRGLAVVGLLSGQRPPTAKRLGMVPRESPTAAGDQESVAATPSPDRRGNTEECKSSGLGLTHAQATQPRRASTTFKIVARPLCACSYAATASREGAASFEMCATTCLAVSSS